jgi:hypothetical protein
MMVGHAMIVDGGQTAAAAREEDRAGFVSVGRYALRGVARPAGGIWYPHTLIVRNATEAAPSLP